MGKNVYGSNGRQAACPLGGMPLPWLFQLLMVAKRARACPSAAACHAPAANQSATCQSSCHQSYSGGGQLSFLPSGLLPKLLMNSVTVGHGVARRLRSFLPRLNRAYGLRRRWCLKVFGKVLAGHGQTMARVARVRTSGAGQVRQQQHALVIRTGGMTGGLPGGSSSWGDLPSDVTVDDAIAAVAGTFGALPARAPAPRPAAPIVPGFRCPPRPGQSLRRHSCRFASGGPDRPRARSASRG